MTNPKTIRLGTRGSPLALLQAQMVEDRLKAAHSGLHVERVVIKTSGDWRPEQGETRLSEIEGGKGLFIREIEKALVDGAIDLAVHSMKDVPSFLPEGLAVDHVLERADARDAFICNDYASYMDLPEGAIVGTSSLRRQSFLLSRRSDLTVVPLRGNVATRLAKMNEGRVQATFLAMAGLTRLGITGDYIHPLSVGDMVPACAQGIIGIETREDDSSTRALLDAIHHHETGLCGYAERAALQVLDGSCHTPIGAHAVLENGDMTMMLVVGSGDGTRMFDTHGKAPVATKAEATDFGAALAKSLKPRIPADIFS